MSRSSSMEDIPEQCKDLFTQDGVLLKACMGRPVTDLNSIGMLCIVQNQDSGKCIEWRPNDLITIDSDTQDQEWAVVNTIGITMSYAKGSFDYIVAEARVKSGTLAVWYTVSAAITLAMVMGATFY